MSLKSDNFYGAEVLHFPCNIPGCEATRLIEEEKKKRDHKPVRRNGDAELDELDRRMREIMRASGVRY
jgi:hypothetical protein